MLNIRSIPLTFRKKLVLTHRRTTVRDIHKDEEEEKTKRQTQISISFLSVSALVSFHISSTLLMPNLILHQSIEI
jgi:hypothetical protein